MKQWIKSFLYIPKHSKPTDENILRLLLPSFVGIVICMVCLAGTTWAWFTASVQTQPQTLAAANFSIEAAVTDAENAPVDISSPLNAGQVYTVTLTASGTADEFGGCCIVKGGGKTYYTEQIRPGNTLTFTFTPETTDVYTFTGVWGEYSGDASIADGAVIGQKQPDNTDEPPTLAETTDESTVYTVQPGDTLWDIAKAHNTTVAAIITCNNMENPNALQIGQKLKLPVEQEQSAPPDGAPTSGTQPEHTMNTK